jgi:hypothetical protein
VHQNILVIIPRFLTHHILATLKKWYLDGKEVRKKMLLEKKNYNKN